MGPGRPEGSMPVTRTKTASGTDSARRVGKAGGATRRADGCPLASVAVRAHLTQRSVTALVNGYAEGFTPCLRRDFDPKLDTESRRVGTLYVEAHKPR